MQTTKTFTDTILEVPYFSQYADVKDPDQRLIACGVTSAYMVLTYQKAAVPDLSALIEQGITNGGYGPSGWKHAYLVGLFREYGLQYDRYENMRDRDVEYFRACIEQGQPVLVSIAWTFWDRRFFHIVLLTGVRIDEEGNLAGFYYHDPASIRFEECKNLFVPLPLFYTSWRRMAIMPERPAAEE